MIHEKKIIVIFKRPQIRDVDSLTLNAMRAVDALRPDHWLTRTLVRDVDGTKQQRRQRIFLLCHLDPLPIWEL